MVDDRASFAELETQVSASADQTQVFVALVRLLTETPLPAERAAGTFCSLCRFSQVGSITVGGVRLDFDTRVAVPVGEQQVLLSALSLHWMDAHRGVLTVEVAAAVKAFVESSESRRTLFQLKVVHESGTPGR